jgi:hypothetical protein
VVGPSGSSLGHWRFALEEDIQTLPSSSFSLLPGHEASGFALPLIPETRGLGLSLKLGQKEK